MALLKEIELDNGVPVRYHRVVSVNSVTNIQEVVEVASYTSRSKREQEAAGGDTDVFVFTTFHSAPFGTCPTAARAYEWLVANVAEFEGAESDEAVEDVSSEEFVSMLEEVM